MKKVKTSIEKIVIFKLESGFTCRKKAENCGISITLVNSIRKRNSIKAHVNKKCRKKIFDKVDQRTIGELISSGQAESTKKVKEEMEVVYNKKAFCKNCQ